jgi:monofunctional biosynthetic peptidoglycan transglycosylase
MRRRVVLLGTAALVLAAAFVVWVWAGLPPRSAVRELQTRNPVRTRLMLQREEEAKTRGRRARVAQSWVPLSRVSRHLIHAVLAAEDQKFFGHEGVDWEAIQSSLEKNVEKRRYARGGSTITQQLAKNLFFGTRKSLIRKVRELVVAHWLETDLGKVRILTLYLNLIEWGDGIYGCEAAAWKWYGKPADALDPMEAAGLAAMIPNPRRLNPEVNGARHERAARRVLWLMALAGYIGRDVAGLGAEPPPPEPVPAEEEEEPPPAAASAGPSPEPTSPPGLELPVDPAVAEPVLVEPAPGVTPAPPSPCPSPPAPCPPPDPSPTPPPPTPPPPAVPPPPGS